MAYVAFAEAPHAGPVTAAPVEIYRAAPPAAVPTPAFSALEWSVVAIAERDGLPSLREPGRAELAFRLHRARQGRGRLRRRRFLL